MQEQASLLTTQQGVVAQSAVVYEAAQGLVSAEFALSNINGTIAPEDAAAAQSKVDVAQIEVDTATASLTSVEKGLVKATEDFTSK